MALHHYPRIVTDGLVLYFDPTSPRSGVMPSSGNGINNQYPNVMPYPTDNFSWCDGASLNNCAISQDTISSPVGNTPLKMECAGSDPYIATYESSTWNLAPASAGESWDFSVYLKTSDNNEDNPQLFIFGADSTGDMNASGEDYSSLYVDQPTATTEWQKFTHGHTFGSGSDFVKHIQVRVDGDNVGSTSHTMWFDGFDVRKSPTWYDPYTGKEGSLVGGVTFKDGHTVFNGHTTYATVKDDRDLQITGEITIGAWIYPAMTGDDFQAVVYKASGGAGQNGYSMVVGPLGGSILALDGVGTYQVFFTSPGDIVADTWQYMLFTADGTNERAYINGTQILEASNGWLPGNGNNMFQIGQAQAYDDERFFSGSIDIVQVYNRALTLKEVQQNYNALKWRFQ